MSTQHDIYITSQRDVYDKMTENQKRIADDCFIHTENMKNFFFRCRRLESASNNNRPIILSIAREAFYQHYNKENKNNDENDGYIRCIP